MNKLKNSTIKIGSNVSLLLESLSTLNSVFAEKNNLKATMSVKFSDEKIIKEKLSQFSFIPKAYIIVKMFTDFRIFTTVPT